MSLFKPDNPVPFLRALFAEALNAADPAEVVPNALGPRPTGPITIVGAGKASATMAGALETAWGSPLNGLVIAREGYGHPTAEISVIEAAHPVPDERGLRATAEIMALVRNAPTDGTLVGLWSGGASALLVQPIQGLSLKEKQVITSSLLASGATIHDINTVRKHLSLVKGGRLAALAQQKTMMNLMISDVVGDDLSVIGSGPTVGDPSTCADAIAILERHGVDVPGAVHQALQSGHSESPKRVGTNVSNRIIASPKDSFAAATVLAEANGVAVMNMGDAIEGEARDVARTMADHVREIAEQASGPTIVLSGGEVTVSLSSLPEAGTGGPNLEFCLALALALDADPRVWAIACDTDGTDGASQSAGAIVSPTTIERSRKTGRLALQDLNFHNSEAFFESLNDLVTPGPTATNVNDFRALLIIPRR